MEQMNDIAMTIGWLVIAVVGTIGGILLCVFICWVFKKGWELLLNLLAGRGLQ